MKEKEEKIFRLRTSCGVAVVRAESAEEAAVLLLQYEKEVKMDRSLAFSAVSSKQGTTRFLHLIKDESKFQRGSKWDGNDHLLLTGGLVSCLEELPSDEGVLAYFSEESRDSVFAEPEGF